MSGPVIVLKLGGSVLASEASLPRAVHEVYRWRRDGFAVVAVPSAFAGETDRLLEGARSLGAGPQSVAAAAATGELVSAALLGASLDRAGVPASVLSPAALALRAEGDPLEATPVALDRAPLAAALEREGVAVVPGFSGIDARGRTALFGRGGSDLSALYLAAALGARCRLVKDVDGLYEWDPSRAGSRPRRFACATWDDALALDGTILQPRAVRLARERGIEFEVARLNGVDATRVGAGPTSLVEPAQRRRPPRVVLLGLGTVGGGVWQHVRALPDELELVAVASRSAARAAGHGVLPSLWHSDPLEALRIDADVVVECLGGLEPARAAIAFALSSGRHVVTANKRVLAEHGPELRRLATAHGARLLASASVGGSAPVLERVAALNGEVRALRGVLNGTANFVLERLAAGAGLAEALRDARSLGLTESDALRDLDGRDAADKLRVIAGALGIDDVEVERAPLRDEWLAPRVAAALERGRRLRQVAELHRDERPARARIGLAELEPDDPLFELCGASNAAIVLGREQTCSRIAGLGAGRWPTAESLLGDLLALARELRRPASAASEPTHSRSTPGNASVAPVALA